MQGRTWSGSLIAIAFAVEFASRELRAQGLRLADDGAARLADYLRVVPVVLASCACGCGTALCTARQKWATDACRKRMAARRVPSR